MLLISVISNSCTTRSTNSLTQEQKDSIEKARQDSIRIADSIQLKETMKADSIARVRQQEKEEQKKELSKNFRVSKDEFSDYAWVYHKTTSKYTNCNSVHLYFQLSDNGVASNLRFSVHYEDDDWLFIRNIIFNIDGENEMFVPLDMETDCGNGGRIWEWCDESANLNSSLVQKIASAKKCKLKLNGSQYYDTRTMSNQQLNAFKQTLDYYRLLGGQLQSE